MKQTSKKINRSIKLFPIFSAFSGDIIFLVPIDTLFLVLTKGLNASQITAMTMISLLVCIMTQKGILIVAKKIGNVNSIKLATILLLISILILTFGKSFSVILLYRCIYEVAMMFFNMSKVLLKNNLISVNRQQDYYRIRNISKIFYAVTTMITAVLSGYLFNINNYWPMYLAIIIYTIVFVASFGFYEAQNEEEETKKDNCKYKKLKMSSTIFWIILSNAMFYSIIKMGQNNSKLLMQYDFQKILSVEMVTYYISVIVFVSRVARLFGNVIFGKVYLKIKDKISILLTILLALAFLILIIGHFLQVDFIYKVIIMALGFFIILAIRDSFNVYAEDIALSVASKEEQQKVMIDIEIYRKIVTLILSAVFTFVLMKHELVVVEFMLLFLAIVEIFINMKMYRKINSNG